MIRYLPLLIALLVFASPPTQADTAQERYEHIRSAFLFAERKNWDDAILHAERSEAADLVSLITWLKLLDTDSGASFNDITSFIETHLEWPEQRKLHIRAEQALQKSDANDNDVIAWFGNDTPITGIGKMALAKALSRQQLSNNNKIESLIRDAWVTGDFEADEEARIQDRYGKLLGEPQHIARIDRLLWEEKISPAERLLARISQKHQQLFTARIALIHEKKNAPALVAAIPASLRNDAGLAFDRMRWRANKNDDHGVRDILLHMPEDAPYPEKWWTYREQQIRKLINEHRYKDANKLLANHGLLEGEAYADALWLQGWLQLDFLNNPKSAYDLFYRMHDKVRFPISKARAAYWAGRAAEITGDSSTANSWYNTASAYPTTFYGQLASLKYNGTAPLPIPAEPYINASDQHRFDNNALIRAARLAVDVDNNDLASRLLMGMIESTKDADEAAMIAAFGKDAGQPFLSVRGAKRALRYHNVIMTKAGYPSPTTPYDAAVERPLVLAITRQESEFDPYAKSPSGALGMMQLLPGTARETARKNGVEYTISRLYEPEYNWTLGSLYLNRMIENYGGSYVMAIAAYNAGPGNVRKWVQQFGTPNNDIENAINWIERIPFSETRNYVQRVLENLQIYRHLLADGETPKLKLTEDLVR